MNQWFLDVLQINFIIIIIIEALMANEYKLWRTGLKISSITFEKNNSASNVLLQS